MSVPVVFLDSMLDQELANRLATIITKHQVTQSETLRLKCEPHCACNTAAHTVSAPEL